jgi:predicted amidohydrolase YtcJ
VSPLTSITNARLDGTLVDVRFNAGAIEAIGTNVATPDALDANGATLLPGFVDAHLHLVMGGTSLSQLDLAGCASREVFEARIEAAHADLPPEAWLICRGWLESDWSGCAPDASWLRTAGNRPVICWKHDHHAILVNDAVQALLPAAQRISSGLFVEGDAWQRITPLIPEVSIEAKQAAAKTACEYLATFGITAVGAMEYAREITDVLAPIREDLAVRLALTMLDRTMPIDEPLARCLEVPNDDRLAFIGCKAFLDGTLGSKTAAMLDGWHDDPSHNGQLVELAARGELFEWIDVVARAGLSPSMHAIGDRAVRLALDAAARTRDVLVRIEHAQTVAATDVARFADRVASMQPIHLRDDGLIADALLGADRMNEFFAFRSLANSGTILAFGSDWPISPPDVLEGIAAAVDGCARDGTSVLGGETITRNRAIEAFTADARASLFMPVITPAVGEPADLVLLADEPPRVLATIMNANLTYHAPLCPTT